MDRLLGASTLEKFLCPELVLLLNKPLKARDVVGIKRYSLCGQLLVDRLQCLRTMLDPTVPADVSWNCGLLLDSVMHCHDEEFDVPVSDCKFSLVCNELTVLLSPLRVSALELSFFESLSTVDEARDLQYLLSKCLNQKCQGRKFTAVALRAIEGNPKLTRHLSELVLCSLLGMYRHSRPSSRPLPDVRKRLFELLRDREGAWLLRLLRSCKSAIVMYCLREHVVFLVEEHPALQRQISALVQFDRFKSIVTEAMAAIRDYLQRMLSTPGTALFQDVASPSEESLARWVQEVTFLLQPSDTAILKTSYRRPKQTFRQLVLTVGNAGVKEEDEIPKLINRQEVDALRRLAERLSAAKFGVLTEMIRWMPLFRIAPEVMQLILLLVDLHNSAAGSQIVLRSFLVRVMELFPREFQYLQIASKMIEDTQHVRPLGLLPYECMRHQIDACQARFGMKPMNELDPGGVVLDHLFSFYYCDVCFAIYSVLADSHSVYKQHYNFAFRDAVQDYQTGHIYCNKKRRNYRGSCSAQPLKSVLLVGKALRVNGSVVMLCPQENCGRPMVVNSNCIINERGPACCYCSQKLQPALLSFQQMIDYYCHSSSVRHCAVCAVELVKTQAIYVYPYRIYVCAAHHFASMASYVGALVAEQAVDVDRTPAEKRAELETMIVDMARQRESSKRAAKAEGDKKAWKKANMLAKIKK